MTGHRAQQFRRIGSIRDFEQRRAGPLSLERLGGMPSECANYQPELRKFICQLQCSNCAFLSKKRQSANQMEFKKNTHFVSCSVIFEIKFGEEDLNPPTGPEPVVLPITPSPIGCTPKSRQARVLSTESTNRPTTSQENRSVCCIRFC